MPLDDIKSDFRYEVKIEGVTAGWFTECSGLTIEREIYPHQEGGQNDYVHQLPGPIKHQSLTLKKGIAEEALWQWLEAGKFDGKVKRCNVSVILYHPDRSEARRWDLINVFPTRWSGAELKTGSRQVAVETLQLTQGGGEKGSGTVQRTPDEGDNASPLRAAEAAGAIDVELLAHKVYNLLKKELRLESERMGRHRW